MTHCALREPPRWPRTTWGGRARPATCARRLHAPGREPWTSCAGGRLAARVRRASFLFPLLVGPRADLSICLWSRGSSALILSFPNLEARLRWSVSAEHSRKRAGRPGVRRLPCLGNRPGAQGFLPLLHTSQRSPRSVVGCHAVTAGPGGTCGPRSDARRWGNTLSGLL